MKANTKYVANDGIELFMCPFTDMYITQGSNSNFSHHGIMANDVRGLESGVRYPYYAPCTCKCLKTYPESGQVMWQSTSKVRFANGRIDFATFMTAHDDSMNAKIGKTVVPQGAQLGNMGSRGVGTGIHCHIEVSQSNDTSWTKKSSFQYNGKTYPIYGFNNEYDLDDCYFVDDTNILYGMGGNWKTAKEKYLSVKEKHGTPVARDVKVNQIEIIADNVRARTSPNGEIKGYMNVGIYNSLETQDKDGYTWHRVDNDLWFAQGDWTVIYNAPKEEQIKDYNLKGIDISHHKDGIEISKLDTDFIIMKATEGVGFKDNKFNDFYSEIQNLGKHSGVYHVGRPDLGNTAKDEADYFLSIVNDCIGKSMLILDLEPKSINVSWAKEWLDYVYSKTGVKPIIYMGMNIENDNDWTSICNDYSLWVASYGINDGNAHTKPTLKNWKSYLLWQYTDKGRLNNYNSDLDLDYFYGKNWNDNVVPSVIIDRPVVEPTEDELQNLKDKIKKLEEENEKLRREDSDKIVYAKKIENTDIYAIELNKGETIIIKIEE